MLRFGLLFAVIGCSSSAPHAVDPQPQPQPKQDTVTAVDTPATAGTVETRSFSSESLGVDKQYLVYLPGGYEGSDASYPVLYLLHGLTGNERSWVDHIALQQTADDIGFEGLIVMPDGDDGFYINWASQPDYKKCLAGSRPFGRESDMATYCVKNARYEDYIAKDLVAHIDGSFRTKTSRDARAISGVSMGGYGALVVAMRNTGMFGAVGSHSGVDALLYKGPRPYARGKVELTSDPSEWIDGAGVFGKYFEGMLGRDIEYWRQRDPATLAESLDKDALAIYLDAGSDDHLELDDGAQYLAEVLTRRGIDHEFVIEPGGHDVPFFKSRIDDGLRFFAAHFGR